MPTPYLVYDPTFTSAVAATPAPHWQSAELDAAGNLWVLHHSPLEVRKYLPGGARDTSFAGATVPTTSYRNVLPTADGGCLAFGASTTQAARKYDAAGSLTGTWPAAASGTVAAEDPNSGKVYFAYASTLRRFTSAGVEDTGTWTAPNLGVATTAVTVLPDGKVLAGYNVTHDGTNHRLARFNTDGSRDTTFDASAALAGVTVNHVTALDGGNLLVSVTLADNTDGAVIKLAADGAAVSGFYTSGVADYNGATKYKAWKAVEVHGGDILVSLTFGTATSGDILRLQPTGELVGRADGSQVHLGAIWATDGGDTAQYVTATAIPTRYKYWRRTLLAEANPGVVSYDVLRGVANQPNTNSSMPGGHAISPTTDGGFVKLQTNDSNHRVATFTQAALRVNGAYDTGTWFSGAVCRLSTGQIAVAYNSTVARRTSTLAASGLADYTTSTVEGLMEDNQNVGAVFVASGTSIKRLTAAANTLDASWTATNLGGTVRAMAQQADGKILAAANLDVSGTIHRLVRLNLDGSRDTTFDATATLTTGIVFYNSIAVQDDGKILVTGRDLVNSTTTKIVRLNSDGTKDTSWDDSPLTGRSDTVRAILPTPSGKVYYTDTGTSPYLFRLNADGTADTAFTAPPGLTSYGTTLSGQLIYGDDDVILADLYVASSFTGAGDYRLAQIVDTDLYTPPGGGPIAAEATITLTATPSATPGLNIGTGTSIGLSVTPQADADPLTPAAGNLSAALAVTATPTVRINAACTIPLHTAGIGAPISALHVAAQASINVAAADANPEQPIYTAATTSPTFTITVGAPAVVNPATIDHLNDPRPTIHIEANPAVNVAAAPPAGGMLHPGTGEWIHEPDPDGYLYPSAKPVYPMRTASVTMPTIGGSPGQVPLMPNTGRPDPSRYVPLSVESDTLGWLQVVIGGTDVTFYRGVPVRVDEYVHSEPFGPTSARLVFPQITPFDTLGAGDLAWAAAGKQVDVTYVDVDGVPVCRLFEGFVVQAKRRALRGETGEFQIELECHGALYQADHQLAKPEIVWDTADVGHLAADYLNSIVGRRYGYTRPVTTGIETRSRSGWEPVLTGRVQDLLASATTSDGLGQWTVACDAGRRPAIRLKDFTTPNWTVYVGAPGVSVDVASDITQAPTSIYGRGVAPDRKGWANLKTPGYHPWLFEPYPWHSTVNNTGQVNAIALGTVDADTDTGTGVTVLQRRLRELGYDVPVDGVAGASTKAAWTAWQHRTGGESSGGLCAGQTWSSLFYQGDEGRLLEDAFYGPLASLPAVEPRLYTVEGKDAGPNPAYVPDRLRVEKFHAYPDGTSKEDAQTYAAAELARDSDPGWTNSITLRTDPVEGSRWRILAGHNVRLRNWAGGGTQLFHVTQVTASPTDGTVTLSVDTRGRDYLTLDAIKERRNGAVNPARRPGIRKVGELEPSIPVIDGELAGYLHAVCFTRLWSIVKVPLHTEGNIVQVFMDSTGPATSFVAAFFASPVTHRELVDRVGDPFAWRPDGLRPFPGDDTTSEWLASKNLIDTAGGPDERTGYFPGRFSQGDPVTGKHRDYSINLNFTSSAPPYIWVAFYADHHTKISGRLHLAPNTP